MNEYKFTPLIIEKDGNGRLLVDEQKLKKLLEEAYSNGYIDGQLSKVASWGTDGTSVPASPIKINYPLDPNVVPTTPTVPQLPPYWYDKFYCSVSTSNLKV